MWLEGFRLIVASTSWKETVLIYSPSVVPSFPIMHLRARMICSVTGGDMAVAYIALWECCRR